MKTIAVLLAIVATATALLLSGCTTHTILKDYDREHPVVVRTNIAHSKLATLEVFISPTDPRRAVVKPTTEDYWDERLAIGFDGWAARAPDYRIKYEAALLGVLAQQGRSCRITEGTAFVDAFLFEFRYQCGKAL